MKYIKVLGIITVITAVVGCIALSIKKEKNLTDDSLLEDEDDFLDTDIMQEEDEEPVWNENFYEEIIN